MPETNPTRDQHYVAQEYLRGFSQDAVTLYEYNIKKCAPIDQKVPIRSVCYEKFLYEIRNNSGEIENINHIENVLCQFEGALATYKRKLFRKANNPMNCNTKCFLSKDEKAFWRFYTVLQIMRNPVSLKGATDIIQDIFPDQYTSYEARKEALKYCLPFFEEATEIEENVFSYFLYLLNSKSLSVGFVGNDHLFTSDVAVFGFSLQKSQLDFEDLWFPISSSVVLYYSGSSETGKAKNKLFPLTDSEVQKLNTGISMIANQMIFSKTPFTKADVLLIEYSRSLKAKEEK